MALLITHVKYLVKAINYDKQDSKALILRPLVNAPKAKKYMSIFKMFKKHSTFQNPQKSPNSNHV